MAVNHHATLLLVKTYVKWPVDCLAVVCDLLLRFLERLGHEVVWLHRADWELYVVLRDFKRVERVRPGLVRHAVLQLANAAKNARPVGLDTVRLSAEPELDCEPVDGC